MVVSATADATEAVGPADATGLPGQMDGITSTDALVVLVWLAAFGGLAMFVRRSWPQVRSVVGVVVLGPIGALVTLQLLVALERLLPTTV